MGSLRVMALAGAAAITSLSTASAADLPPLMQRVMPAPIEEVASGWYLRGDIGVGLQTAKSLDIIGPAAAQGNFVMTDDAFSTGDAYFIGGGVGYQFNSWLRFDATAEYRAKQSFKAAGFYTQGGGTFYDIYDGHYSSTVVLANAYLDLGTWNCFTPFIGAGFGFAANTINSLYDLGPFTPGGGAALGVMTQAKTEFGFAWAVHAGVAYTVTPNLKLEMAYRYLNLGSTTSGLVDCGANGVCGGVFSYKLREVDSHDIKLGFRYMFNEPTPVYAPPPLMSKG